MPRAGLDPAAVTVAAAVLADEVGLHNVTMGALAERLGVRAPSLYKHIDSQADLTRRIAVLVADELADTLRDALQGKAGRDALAAAAHAMRAYIVGHPGRYAAMIRLGVTGPDDPLAAASSRVLNSLAAVLSGYNIDPADTVHALRLLRSLVHGFAIIESQGGFEMDTDINETFEWLIDFIDGGLSRQST